MVVIYQTVLTYKIVMDRHCVMVKQDQNYRTTSFRRNSTYRNLTSICLLRFGTTVDLLHEY